MLDIIDNKINELSELMNKYEYELNLIAPATSANIHKVDSYVKHIDRLYWQIKILKDVKEGR